MFNVNLETIGGARPLPAPLSPPLTRPDRGRASTALRAYRAVPLWATCPVVSLGPALWAVFRAVPAQEARP